ncbi:FadR/GntR family transcriptional regulator [Marinomonas flavescens]|uniref:FadR/GntR family transcriptional regulator n=1 Tax=Marinomonas flavescens TaxID=2529379 RepID=UPI001056D0FD|nr:FadR/GntR family transcriptional regulator [Marinomonas flavescens]
MSNNAFLFEKTLKNKTKKDVLAGKILEMIFTGLLQHDDVLPSERELGGMFGVSRETVRGALSIISAYGLISVSHGSKTRVVRNEEALNRCLVLLPELNSIEVNNYDVHSVFESRRVVESAIARSAAVKIDEKGLKELNNLLDQQKKLFDEPVHFQLSDKSFHKIISEYSGNSILVGYAEDLYRYGLNFRRMVMRKEGSIEKSYLEHMEIYRALSEKNPEKAEEAMLSHIESVYKTTIEAINHADL